MKGAIVPDGKPLSRAERCIMEWRSDVEEDMDDEEAVSLFECKYSVVANVMTSYLELLSMTAATAGPANNDKAVKYKGIVG